MVYCWFPTLEMTVEIYGVTVTRRWTPSTLKPYKAETPSALVHGFRLWRHRLSMLNLGVIASCGVVSISYWPTGFDGWWFYPIPKSCLLALLACCYLRLWYNRWFPYIGVWAGSQGIITTAANSIGHLLQRVVMQGFNVACFVMYTGSHPIFKHEPNPFNVGGESDKLMRQ